MDREQPRPRRRHHARRARLFTGALSVAGVAGISGYMSAAHASASAGVRTTQASTSTTTQPASSSGSTTNQAVSSGAATTSTSTTTPTTVAAQASVPSGYANTSSHGS